MDRIGYCLHIPTCENSESCKAKRALEQQQSTKPKVYIGQVAMPRKLDWEP